jgi:hypothetical protein
MSNNPDENMQLILSTALPFEDNGTGSRRSEAAAIL